MFYAGIGSRQTPPDTLIGMKLIAKALASLGYILRSGGAIGADQAFESGAGIKKDIYYAHQASQPAIQLASQYHPAWHRCSDYAKRLHGRNMHILLGSDVNHITNPVRFVICWTPNGEITGGTGQALRYAIDKGIKIYNLAINSDKIALVTLLEESGIEISYTKQHKI